MNAFAIDAFEEHDLSSRHLRGRDFAVLYRGVMKLIQDTTDYLDGEGRRQCAAMTGRNKRDYLDLMNQVTNEAVRLGNVMWRLKTIRDGETDYTRGMAEIAKLDIGSSPSTGVRDIDGIPSEMLETVRRTDDMRVEAERFLARLRTEASNRPNAVHKALDMLDGVFGGNRTLQ